MTVYKCSGLWTGVVGVIVFICVQCVSCGVIEECRGVKEVLGEVGGSSHFGGVGGGAHQSLCSPGNTSSTDCCSTSLADTLLSSSNIVLSTFNNTDQFNRFKSKISMYEEVISTHESSNVELWNATIDGLRVLRSWGVKYWDPQFLQRNNVFSNECGRKVVSSRVCGACSKETPPVKPCKSLCHNVVIGCIKPFAEYIESPWKHAVSSVRTAIRLVITTGGDAKQNTQTLQELVSDLNDWREPVTWWISDYKRTVSCEGLPTSSCWNGESIGKYEFATANWKSAYNPEFGEFVGGGVMEQSVVVELERFRNELVGVRKSLEKYWPTTQSSQRSLPPHALALSSSEQIQPRSSYLHDLTPETGSGDSYESDDEDIGYSNSGYGPHIQETDDEDLDGYGSGSGDGDITEPDVETNNPIKVTDGVVTDTPVSLSCSGYKFISPVLLCFAVLVCFT